MCLLYQQRLLTSAVVHQSEALDAAVPVTTAQGAQKVMYKCKPNTVLPCLALNILMTSCNLVQAVAGYCSGEDQWAAKRGAAGAVL